MATAYACGRVSHANQVDGDSVPAQGERCQKYYDYALHSDGVAWGGFFYDDKNVSAFRKPFFKRPSGRKVLALLRPGDHIIFDKVDRVWRSNEDFVDLMRWFKTRNITVHFVTFSGCSIRMGTPMGDFMLRFFVSQAELESARIGERIRDEKAYRRVHGLYSSGSKNPPLGCTVVGRIEKRGGVRMNNMRLEWDLERRAVMQQILFWHEDGRTGRWIASQLEKMRVESAGEEYLPSAACPFWTRAKINYAIRREGALRWLGGSPDPNKINFRDLDRRYLEAKWAEKGPGADAARTRALKRYATKRGTLAYDSIGDV